MKRRICPICDREMKGKHYCRNCHSWVKEPYEREIGYFLNERHPMHETACSYHSQLEQPQKEEAKPSRVRQKQQKKQQQKEKRQYPGGSGLAAVLAVAVIGYVLFTFSSEQTIHFLDSGVISKEPETVTVQEEEYVELDEAEVQSAGVPCNFFLHFNVNGLEMTDSVQELLAEREYEISDIWQSSYNGKFGEITSYSTSSQFDIEGAFGGYVTISYDTGDQRLHEVRVMMDDGEAAVSLAGDLVRILEDKGAFTGYGFGNTVETELTAHMEADDFQMEIGNLSVYWIVSSFEEGKLYEIFLSPTKE